MSGIPGQLPSNFVVYDNDKYKLVEELESLKENFNAEYNLANFKREQGHFLYGNTNELKRFTGLVMDGTINSKSHKRYPTLSSLVQAIGDKI